MKIHAFRLLPGADLKKAIQSEVEQNKMTAGWIVTCVGSLTQYNIRFANQDQGRKEKGYFEIVSLAGTLSINGSHVHISVSDGEGKTVGGHLLDENFIYTTAEIVIGYEERMEFYRENDGSTPWPELQIRPLNH
jgi:uncharacterized protein